MRRRTPPSKKVEERRRPTTHDLSAKEPLRRRKSKNTVDQQPMIPLQKNVESIESSQPTTPCTATIPPEKLTKRRLRQRTPKPKNVEESRRTCWYWNIERCSYLSNIVEF
uniref:Uncharacterized protein n=1 Tax=Cucumis melo TaxID=3656 RepID=A0A9I9CVE0_CUCME